MITLSRDSLTVSRDNIVAVCAVFCLVNIILVLLLAGTGVLKTAERGDVTYSKVEETPGEDIVIPAESDDRFVVERPTDVDAFYDAIVRIRHGGPLINPWGDADTVQRYHYHPIVILIFYPLYFLGYLGFKIVWLLLSVAFTAGGTYLLLRAEADYWNFPISKTQLGILSIAAIGFAPMVTNFKSGQSTPLMYLFVALTWWYFRRSNYSLGGTMLSVPLLIKPYFIAPLVIYVRRDRAIGVLTFVGGGIAANILAGVTIGWDTVVDYYVELAAIGPGQAETSIPALTFDAWFSNSLRMFYWFGEVGSLVVFGLFAVPLAYATLTYLFEQRAMPADMYAYSAGLLMLWFPVGSVVDLAMVLAAVVVLGFRIYVHGTDLAMIALGVSFLLMHVHPYFMEFFVGAGPLYIQSLYDYEQLILTVIPYLQPAMWGLIVLAGLLTLSIAGRVSWHEQAVIPEEAE